MPQSQTATSSPRRKEKGQNIHAQNKQTYVREAQRPVPSSPSEVIRMLEQTEERGQRARDDLKTLSAPWYKPQSYTELRTTSGPPVLLWPYGQYYHNTMTILEADFVVSTECEPGGEPISWCLLSVNIVVNRFRDVSWMWTCDIVKHICIHHVSAKNVWENNSTDCKIHLHFENRTSLIKTFTDVITEAQDMIAEYDLSPHTFRKEQIERIGLCL